MGEPPEWPAVSRARPAVADAVGAALFRRHHRADDGRAGRGSGPVARQVYENLFLPQAPVWFVAMVLALLASGEMGLLKGARRGSCGRSSSASGKWAGR